MVVINHLIGNGIVIQGIARKIAAQRIFGLAAKGVVTHDAALLVLRDLIATAIGGDFNGFRPRHHMHDAKTATNDAAAFENSPHFFWGRIGGNVKILGRQTHHQVAHTTAHNHRIKTALMQLLHDFLCRIAQFRQT